MTTIAIALKAIEAALTYQDCLDGDMPDDVYEQLHRAQSQCHRELAAQKSIPACPTPLDLRAVLTYAHRGIHTAMAAARATEDWRAFNAALDQIIALEAYAMQQGFRNMDDVLAGELPARPPVMEQAFLATLWELGGVPHPETPPDLAALAAEYLARKFRVGQRLRFVGGEVNLRVVPLDPDTLVDSQGQVGTVVATPDTRVVQIRFDAWPDYPVRMFAADEEFEVVA